MVDTLSYKTRKKGIYLVKYECKKQNSKLNILAIFMNIYWTHNEVHSYGRLSFSLRVSVKYYKIIYIHQPESNIGRYLQKNQTESKTTLEKQFVAIYFSNNGDSFETLEHRAHHVCSGLYLDRPIEPWMLGS